MEYQIDSGINNYELIIYDNGIESLGIKLDVFYEKFTVQELIRLYNSLNGYYNNRFVWLDNELNVSKYINPFVSVGRRNFTDISVKFTNHYVYLLIYKEFLFSRDSLYEFLQILKTIVNKYYTIKV